MRKFDLWPLVWLKVTSMASTPINFKNSDVCKIKGVTKRSRLTNCRFTTISSQISAIYINISHKTEIQTVILRCWIVLYINWLKSYDENEKHPKTQKTQKSPKTVHKIFFLQNRTKTKMEKIVFFVITFEPIKIQTHSTPQNDRLNFRFVKDIHVDGVRH